MLINIKNSFEFATYELSIAQKYKDSQKALKYHNITKITDSYIKEMTNELYKEDDAMIIALGSGVIANFKETLPHKIEQTLITDYESDPGKIKDINDLKILYLCLIRKPVTADKLITSEFAKNKIKQSYCSNNDKEEKNCFIRIWENEKEGWRVIDFRYPIN